jgi:type VI secretion system secreted protein Hcp
MAQPDYFLKLDGINGESEDSVHKNEIQLSSVTWGVSNQGAGGFGKGSGASKSDVHDVHVTKLVDTSSPALAKACATGLTIGDAVITLRKAGGTSAVEYLVYKLTEVFVSSFNIGAGDGGNIAQESIGLNFAKVEFNYTPQNADGSAGGTITTSYDVKQNLGG